MKTAHFARFFPARPALWIGILMGLLGVLAPAQAQWKQSDKVPLPVEKSTGERVLQAINIEVNDHTVMEGDTMRVECYIWNDDYSDGTDATEAFLYMFADMAQDGTTSETTVHEYYLGVADVISLPPNGMYYVEWRFTVPENVITNSYFQYNEVAIWVDDAATTNGGGWYAYDHFIQVTKRLEQEIAVTPNNFTMYNVDYSEDRTESRAALKLPEENQKTRTTAPPLRFPASGKVADLPPHRKDVVMVRLTPDQSLEVQSRFLAGNRCAGVCEWQEDFSALGLRELSRYGEALRPFGSGYEKARRKLRTADSPLYTRLSGGLLDDSERAAATRILRDASSPVGPMGMFYLKLKKGANPVDVCESLMGNGGVISANPVRLCRPFASPNDPYYSYQWNLTQIKAEQGWEVVDNDAPSGVRVCVIDTGVRLNHQELSGRLADEYDNYPENGDAYNAGGAYEDDDLTGHGTGVAGIIAAVRNNGVGMAGIAPVTIIPVNSVDDEGYIVNYEDAIYWGVDHGADVINLSFGAEGTVLQSELDAADYCEENDVVVVAAVGNDNISANSVYPAAIPYYMGVGAVDTSRNRVVPNPPLWDWGSNTGSIVDVVAPGMGVVGNEGYSIYTLGSNGSAHYRNDFWGTSAAAAHVSGLCALLKHKKNWLNAYAIREIVENTATDLGPTGRDDEYGHGLINAYQATLSARMDGFFLIENEGTLPLHIDSIRLQNYYEDFYYDPAPSWCYWWRTWEPDSWSYLNDAWNPPGAFSIEGLGYALLKVKVNYNQVQRSRGDLRFVIRSNDADENPYPNGVYMSVLLTPSEAGLEWNLLD